jgi:hypothetical protein
MASSLNKRKYADEEVEDSTATSKKQWAFGDDGDSSSSSLEERRRGSLLRRNLPGKPALMMVTPLTHRTTTMTQV